MKLLARVLPFAIAAGAFAAPPEININVDAGKSPVLSCTRGSNCRQHR
jgi:hypothetical protein